MYSTILLPVNGSGGSDELVNRTLNFAQRVGASVHVLHVVAAQPGPDTLSSDQHEQLHQPLEQRGRDAIARIHDHATALDIETTRVVREGVPHQVILDYAAEHGVELIVMGRHGRTGVEQVGLGSTTERVVALADAPVVAVPVTDEAAADVDEVDYDRVVIATDGSDAAERAAERGLEIAETYDADVSVSYVIDTATYDLKDAPRSIIGLLREGGQNAVEVVATDGRDRGLSVNTDVRRGIPHEEITTYADGVGGDLVVLGTRGVGGATGDLLGSTTARVLRRTASPILTVG
ncbi:UspA domain protein (plasmid) [Natrialba magadii ATCC 43099]|uniref:UspA domain protein n=1 Tax=Natrialba magadii (strain ATCC 43099 / DSM 3394 / CCM 3739 / CIP 104546 / IAM 13178 / JCM 8861 / NBRC 102185 / NCIMB 2190 / MS3) TaxID=547559 RepID=D3T0W8_NATMM|nr:universal stress protein [Natrialba magadii]ADD07227.2 UspA domain protein [Natrialba magadii ATCC 43099]ELY34339.1 UspA domain-containing protein [Natrialba magadii ATCC 43099]